MVFMLGEDMYRNTFNIKTVYTKSIKINKL